jgi:DNA-binding MarR family transcriptional regulator
MMPKVSGEQITARILEKMSGTNAAPEEVPSTELSRPAQRVLGIISTENPRSIHELVRLAGPVEGGVSRILNVLAKTGFVRVEYDGRANVPALTEEGKRKVAELGVPPGISTLSQEKIPQIRNLSVSLPSAPCGDLGEGHLKINGAVIIRLRTHLRRENLELREEDVELTAFSTFLLDNWWRIVSRRDQPFDLLPIDLKSTSDSDPGILRVRALGGLIELAADAAHETVAKAYVAEDRFTENVIEGVIRPIVLYLHNGRLFDQPIETRLRRLEDTLQHKNEKEFCRAAGGLGLSPYNLVADVATRIRSFIAFTADEDARLDLASALNLETLNSTLEWLKKEIEYRESTNSLPGLPALHNLIREMPPPDSRIPYRIGYGIARSVRAIWNISEDKSVGGIEGLSKLCGGEKAFSPSASAVGIVRGFQARGKDKPVILVRDDGPASNLFLMARGIGDYVWFGSREAPIANLYTNRQALGRAFAAEFLAPAAAVTHMVEEEGRLLDEVARHFGVEIAVVQHQYDNARELRLH